MAKIQYVIKNIDSKLLYNEKETLCPYIYLELDLYFTEETSFIIIDGKDYTSININLVLTPQDFFDLTGIEWKVNSKPTEEDELIKEELKKETDGIKEILLNKTFELDLGIKNALRKKNLKPNKNEILAYFPRRFTLEEAKQLCLKYVFKEEDIKIINIWDNSHMLLITIPNELSPEQILKSINRENEKKGIFACYKYENELFLK